MSEIPAELAASIGTVRYTETANFPVERGYIWTSCASVENGNPLFWDDKVADEVTGGPIAPPSTLSLWFRPHHWEPGQAEGRLPLQTHFDLKDQLGLPEAIMSDSQVVFHDPVRPGDVIGTREILRSISDPKTTKLGTGRFWVIDVEYRNQDDALVGVETFTGFGYRRSEAPTPAPAPAAAAAAAEPAPVPSSPAGATAAWPPAVGDALPTLDHDVTATTVVLGALATRDWRPMHHDVDFAVNRNGTRDIFLNTPNQQAWLERYVTDWTGPRGRPGRLRFRMLDSVFPHETMTITGTVSEVGTDEAGCGWATVAIELRAGGRLCTTSTVRVALPTDPDDNPWRRRGDQWQP
ncbi:MAG TPA: MaoC family dehydratase N-terminal domain-containing protein [Acidimicrobiales bacterium]|nr:MaoC family dehydratase N-terminal domain-containing protein [Acidimicrobiales bacterium]